jgi:CheY-like chemotaxis protein
MKCLLVDDEDGIREGLAALLQLRGHEVRTAADREQALRLLAQQQFDLVITDWRLPDGNAHDVVDRASGPVIAASGHPEEITGKDRLFALLQKPILPSKLFALLDQVAATVAPLGQDVTIDALPLDVREVVAAALEHVDLTAAHVCDDGTYVTLVAPSNALALAAWRELGGDFRQFERDGRHLLQIRWLRDGRPDAAMQVVGVQDPWPATAAAFAIDFAGQAPQDTEWPKILRRVESARAAGVHVCFLNLPYSARVAIETSADRHFLPMKERIGPRIPPALADLWS